MNVLISGAGVAGLTVAYWLHQSGHQVTVIEKAPDIRTQGYMIDFGGTGWDVAERMGLIPALQKKQHLIDQIQYKNGKGKTTSQITLSRLYQTANVAGKFMVLNRRDLVAVLYETVRDKVNICFDTTIQEIDQSTGGVEVILSNGSTQQFDILVGADGIHSHVRQLIFGTEENLADYLGYRFSIFMTPRLNEDIGHSYQMYVAPGHQVGIYPYSDDAWMVFVIERSDDPTIPPMEERAHLLHRFLPQDQWVIGELLASLSSDTYIFMDTVQQIRMPRWFDKQVVLIGDAAYCPTLISGQGASMAMAGAYFLAEAITTEAEPQLAFQQYENRLRPYIEKIQESARKFAPNFVPQSHLRIRAINWVLRLSGFPIVSDIIGKQFAVQSILDAG